MEIKSNENNNVEKIVNEENKAYTTCPDCGSPISFEMMVVMVFVKIVHQIIKQSMLVYRWRKYLISL